MMLSGIDPEPRDVAASLIAQFRDGVISFDELEVRWPDSADLALKGISEGLWDWFYSDLNHVVIGPKRQLTSEEADLLDRCVLFLRATLPYKWQLPVFSISSLIGRVFKKRENQIPSAEQGDRDVWPFFRRDELKG